MAYQYKVLPFGLSLAPRTYTMHGCGSLPSATDGNLHTQLPQRLAHSVPVAGGFNIALCISPGPLEKPLLAKARHDLRHGAQKEGCHDRRFQQGLGSAVRRQTDLRYLVREGVGPAHQLPRNASSVPGLSIIPAGHTGTPCASKLRQQVRGVIHTVNHQGGLVSKRLCTLANDLLVWAQNNLRSLKATHVPGKINHGADMLSWNNVSSGEWTLHPLAVQKIWEVCDRARVDLFASKDHSHCPIFFTNSTNALVHEWPSLLLYAFPPIALENTVKQSRFKHLGAGPEWPSGEPGEFPVGRSAPLINWAGRLACFFCFVFTYT